MNIISLKKNCFPLICIIFIFIFFYSWAAGIDRLAMILDDNKLPSRKRPIAIIIIPDREKVTSFDTMISPKNNKLYYYGLNLSKSLRDKDIPTLFYHPPPSSRQPSLKTIL